MVLGPAPYKNHLTIPLDLTLSIYFEFRPKFNSISPIPVKNLFPSRQLRLDQFLNRADTRLQKSAEVPAEILEILLRIMQVLGKI